MRIAFISTQDGAPWGGSELLWTQTALRLREEGHAVAASVAHFPQLAPRISALRAAGIALHVRTPRELGLAGRLRRKFTHARRWEWLRGFQPDLVVISQGSVGGDLDGAFFCRSSGLPYALVEHLNCEYYWPSDARADEMREVYDQARRVFFVSKHNWSLTEWQLGGPIGNGEVVLNPLNLKEGPPPAWPDEAHGYELACVGRLEPGSKGQDILLHILTQTKWRERAVRVNFYGSGASDRTVRRLADHLGVKNARFHGQVEEVGGIWAKNHLLILPSREEGLPIVLMEAMSLARPAILTAVGGNAEACRDGETGFIATAAHPVLFEETMERAWQQRAHWQEMGRQAQKRFAQLVPADPVGLFGERLLRLASAGA